MPPRPVGAAVVAALLCALVGVASPAQEAPGATPAAATPLAGHWVLEGTEAGRLRLELFWEDGTNWPRWIQLAELRGLSGASVGSPTPAPVQFRMEQDAGTFEFTGSFREGRGSGGFRFRPDRRFPAVLRSLGVEGIGEVTDHDLKNLAFGGMSAAAVREFREMGFAPLAWRDVVELAIRQVTPEYARTMQSLGVSDADVLARVVELRFLGVSTEYVRELHALGYRGLSSRQLIELRRGGVTPAFVRRVREAGHRDASPEELVRMRRSGTGSAVRRGPSAALGSGGPLR